MLLKDCPSSWINGLLCLLSRFFRSAPKYFIPQLIWTNPSCLASSCPALVPVWTSLLSQTRINSTQVCAGTFLIRNFCVFQAGLVARQLVSLEAVCRHQGVGSALLQPDLVLSLLQRTALALDRAAHWNSEEHLGLALAGHLVGQAKPLPCPEKRQLVATAITLHSLQLEEGQQVGIIEFPCFRLTLLPRSPQGTL